MISFNHVGNTTSLGQNLCSKLGKYKKAFVVQSEHPVHAAIFGLYLLLSLNALHK